MTTRRPGRWLTAIALSLGLAASTMLGTAQAADDTIHTYRSTPGDVASERFQLEAGDTDVFVTKYSNRSNNRVHVARFASDTTTPEMTVTNNAPITSWRVFPERYYPQSAGTVAGNTLTFELSPELPYAIVEINGSQPLLAIVNDPLENPADIPDPSAANVVNLADFVTDATGATDQTAQFNAAIDALYDNAGKDTLFIPDGWYQYAGLELKNRTKPVTIYVDEGALLKNRMQPTMEAMEPAIGIWDSANITVRGRGVFDGNGFANYDTANGGWRHDAATSEHQGGAMVVRSQNIVFHDTLLRDAKQWNWETHTAKNVTFNNIKGLTPYAQPWIDGLDLASGQNLTVNGALTLGNDDGFATGHYNPSDGFPGNPDRYNWDTEDSFGYSINDTLGWSAGAGNGIRMGHAAYGHAMKDYVFDNVNYVGFGAGGHGITVQNPNASTKTTYPRYESIIIRNSSFDTANVGTNFAVRGLNTSNRIGTVKLENLWFSHDRPSSVNNVTDLTITGLKLAGTPITRLTQMRLNLVDIVNRNFDFVEDVAPVFAPLSTQTIQDGESLAFRVEASDGDGHDVTITVGDPGLPAGASFDGSVFSWTPTHNQLGTHVVSFIATDELGATAMTTATIVVTNPNISTVALTPVADTNAQTWNTEETLNYGDNEHLRVMNFNDSATGELGHLYPGGQGSKDAKLTFLSFDLSELADELDDASIEKVELELTYFGPTKGAMSGTDTIKVAPAAAGWIEGNGKTTPTTRTNSVSGALTWLNKPVVDGSHVVESAPFDVTAAGRMGNDNTYVANQTPIGTKARVDVTSLAELLGDDQSVLSLAVNETQKKDIIFVSKEGAARNPNAAGMAPSLIVTLRADDEISAPDVTVTTTTRCVAGKTVLVVTTENAEAAPADVTVSTLYGAKTFTLAAGARTSHAFTTRQATLGSGEVSVSATSGDAAGDWTVPHQASTCGS
ncbi:MAG TPA: putative Ig domain-containing protein [Arachnia sp.]|nr:putative Ig domain-containing protein [Arachnia sp.]HMT86413.1 putative Ig domain-containing protein [Arachnia sp.]